MNFDNPLAELAVYYDNITGALLDPVEGQCSTISYVKSGVYRKTPRAIAVGGHFVTLKCVGIDKGDDEQRPEYRSRLVAPLGL